MTTKEALDKFVAWRGITVARATHIGEFHFLKQFFMHLRTKYTTDPNIIDVTIEDVVYYLEMMVDFGWDQNSFVARCNALKRFFEYYQLQGYPVLHPKLIPMPKQRLKLPRIADEKDYKKMLSVIPKTKDPHHARNLVIAKIIWDTGARVMEVLDLDLDELGNKSATIRTEKSTNKRPFRVLAWTNETQQYLDRWLKIREGFKFSFDEPKALFLSISNRHAGYRFGYAGFTNAILKYCNAAGISYINPHSARHKMGRDLFEYKGIGAVMEGLGHSNIQSSQIYAMMDKGGVKKLYKAVRGE